MFNVVWPCRISMSLPIGKSCSFRVAQAVSLFAFNLDVIARYYAKKKRTTAYVLHFSNFRAVIRAFRYTTDTLLIQSYFATVHHSVNTYLWDFINGFRQQ